jgi:hypothetical protein
MTEGEMFPSTEQMTPMNQLGQPGQQPTAGGEQIPVEDEEGGPDLGLVA